MPSCIVHGELDRKPLEIIAKTRALSVWVRLLTTTETKLSTILYKFLYNMHMFLILENTMNECGYSGIWSNQTLNVSRNEFKYMIKPRLNDHFFQLWRSDVLTANLASIIEFTLSLEKYLINLPLKYQRIFFKL